MARILSEIVCKNPQTDSTVLRFFRRFGLHDILKVCGVRKEKGLHAWDILLCLISMVFTNKSIPALEKEENLSCGKSSLFRFLDNPCYCWRKVVLLFDYSAPKGSPIAECSAGLQGRLLVPHCQGISGYKFCRREMILTFTNCAQRSVTASKNQ